MKVVHAAAGIGLCFAVAQAESPQVARASHAPAEAPIAALLAKGDSLYTHRSAREALALYLDAARQDAHNYEAHWKASRTEVDLAETMAKGAAMDSLLERARVHATEAIAIRPKDAEGRFAHARALGRKALSVGTMERIKFSKVIYSEASEALAYDSTHAGALHVLGMWHAEILRVNGFARTFAKTFLGAQVFSKASWDEAQRLLETAVRVDPKRIVHRLDLAAIYADRGDKARARELYQWIATAPLIEFNDELYKRQATERLKRL
jgi:Flp pilus assembly protein TadD